MTIPQTKSFVTSILIVMISCGSHNATCTNNPYETRVQELPKIASNPKYEPRYNTIMHRILKLESEVAAVDDSMYRFLDVLIDEAKAKIPRALVSGCIEG